MYVEGGGRQIKSKISGIGHRLSWGKPGILGIFIIGFLELFLTWHSKHTRIPVHTYLQTNMYSIYCLIEFQLTITGFTYNYIDLLYT